MRLIAAVVLASLLAACAHNPQSTATATVAQTVTVTKTVPVYPPDSLYSINSGCKHSPKRKSGTVNDLADALISERAAVDVCLGDRAALRNWAKDNK